MAHTERCQTPTRVCIANLLQANPTAPTGRLEINSWKAYRGNKNNNELYESLVCCSLGQEPITPAQAQCLTNWADKERLRARLTFEKQLRDGPSEKLWGGGEFSSPRNFFSLSNSLYEFFLGHSMNIFLGLIGVHEFFFI